MRLTGKQLSLLITDQNIINDITRASNWNGNVYVGSTTGIQPNQYYITGDTLYIYTGNVLHRVDKFSKASRLSFGRIYANYRNSTIQQRWPGENRTYGNINVFDIGQQLTIKQIYLSCFWDIQELSRTNMNVVKTHTGLLFNNENEMWNYMINNCSNDGTRFTNIVTLTPYFIRTTSVPKLTKIRPSNIEYSYIRGAGRDNDNQKFLEVSQRERISMLVWNFLPRFFDNYNIYNIYDQYNRERAFIFPGNWRNKYKPVAIDGFVAITNGDIVFIKNVGNNLLFKTASELGILGYTLPIDNSRTMFCTMGFGYSPNIESYINPGFVSYATFSGGYYSPLAIYPIQGPNGYYAFLIKPMGVNKISIGAYDTNYTLSVYVERRGGVNIFNNLSSYLIDNRTKDYYIGLRKIMEGFGRSRIWNDVKNIYFFLRGKGICSEFGDIGIGLKKYRGAKVFQGVKRT